jgi:hypothetical protein
MAQVYAECGGCGRLYNLDSESEMEEMETHDCSQEECDHTNIEWVSGEEGVVISLNGDVFAICKDCGAEARSSEQPEEKGE